MTHNQIELYKSKETARHNLVAEDLEQQKRNIESGSLHENIRHNYATENLESGKLGESIRHNYATENLEQGKLSETIRHNYATEAYNAQQAQAALQQAQAAHDRNVETARHNQAEEFWYDVRYAPKGANYFEWAKNHTISTTGYGDFVDSAVTDWWWPMTEKAYGGIAKSWGEASTHGQGGKNVPNPWGNVGSDAWGNINAFNSTFNSSFTK